MLKTIMEIEKSVTATMLAAGEYGLRQAASEGLSMSSPHGIRRVYAEMVQAAPPDALKARIIELLEDALATIEENDDPDDKSWIGHCHAVLKQAKTE